MLRFPLRSLLAFSAVMAIWSPTAQANLLVDPTGGTTIPLTPYGYYSAADEGIANRSIGGAFNFLGTSISTITVTVNGSLNLNNNSVYADAPLARLPGTINPFFDDLYLYNGSSLSDQVVAGQYYAVTWNNAYNVKDTTIGRSDTFQVVLFTGDTTLNGFHFQGGDIAFSYGPMLQRFNTGTATVGLSSANGSTTVALPGTTDGQINSATPLPTGSNFVLFHPNANGGATASIQSVSVPEPASWVLLGAGLALATRLRWVRAAQPRD